VRLRDVAARAGLVLLLVAVAVVVVVAALVLAPGVVSVGPGG